jgi:hypothetical protein
MTKNGIDIGKVENGLSPEHLKAKLEFETNNKKLSNEFWQKIYENIFSANFFVFLIVCAVLASGFVYMYRANTLAEIIEYWKLILPVVTTYIGYAIGKSQS